MSNTPEILRSLVEQVGAQFESIESRLDLLDLLAEATIEAPIGPAVPMDLRVACAIAEVIPVIYAMHKAVMDASWTTSHPRPPASVPASAP